MSISLPNGTLLTAPSTSTAHYTAAVTRILHLADFSAELRTRDLQLIFKDYENEKGGFRIKWVDDNNALAVFGDASIAKKAYLRMLLNPPSNFGGSIKPYDRPDAAQIIATLSARQLGHRGSTSTARQSFSMPLPLPSDIPPASGPVPPAGLPSGSSVHVRRGSMTASGGVSGLPGGAFGGFTMPTTHAGKQRASVSGISGTRPVGAGHHSSGSMSGGFSGSMGPPPVPSHARTGSLSRQPLTGVLSFNNASNSAGNNANLAPSGGRGKLATHPESSATSRSGSSSDNEPIVVVNEAPFGQWGGYKSRPTNGHGTSGGRASFSARRDSLSAEKALKEVEKALASVEAQS